MDAGSESEKVKLKLTIAVEGVEYDAEGEAWGRRGQAGVLCAARVAWVPSAAAAYCPAYLVLHFAMISPCCCRPTDSAQGQEPDGCARVRQLLAKPRRSAAGPRLLPTRTALCFGRTFFPLIQLPLPWAESEHVKLGAYHTIELELQRAFQLAVRRVPEPAEPQNQ